MRTEYSYVFPLTVFLLTYSPYVVEVSHAFRFTGPSARTRPCCLRRGVRKPHSDSAGNHSPGARGPGPDRVRPDGHRENRGVHAADPATAIAGWSLACPAGPDSRADAR